MHLICLNTKYGRSFWQALMILLALLVHPVAKAQTTQEYRLNNGMKLIVREDHRAPVVMSQVWYKIGSSYEPLGITGISHALEHMMFKGTQQHPAGEFSHIIANEGGQENASTSSDYTFYYQELAANKLPLSFQLEADRMQNLTLSDKEFVKEIQVVIAERRMRTDDNPQSITFERFSAASHISDGYHHPVIGWLNDLNHMTVNDLKQWYQQWYAPNNATLVVVGDVNSQQVFNLANHYFGVVPVKQLPVVKPQSEIASLGTRRVEVKIPAELPWFVMGYNVPSRVTAQEPWHAYALQVLAAILDGGSSARLEKTLVREKKIASDISIDYDLYSRLDGLLTITGTPTANHSAALLEAAILDQIKQLQTTLVNNDEITRVKTQLIASKTYEKDSIVGQAIEIGSLESIGLSWRVAEDYVKNIQAITPQQIQTVAKLYLIPDRLTIAVLTPEAGKKPVKTPTASQPGAPYVR